MLTEKDISKAIEKMPSLPLVVLETIKLLDMESLDLGLLNKTIETDPILAGRVLSVANSSFYGLQGKVSSLREAFIVLGSHTIRNIVLTAGVVGTFPPKHNSSLDILGLWRHSIGTAVTCRIIVETTGYDADTAHITGLLHHIGKFVLDTCFNEDYIKVTQYCLSEACLLCEAEQKILGVDHSCVGSLLAKYWQLPNTIVDGIKYYTQTRSSSVNLVADHIHIANMLCRRFEIGDSGDRSVPIIDPMSLQRLELDIGTLENYRQDIEGTMAPMLTLLK